MPKGYYDRIQAAWQDEVAADYERARWWMDQVASYGPNAPPYLVNRAAEYQQRAARQSKRERAVRGVGV